MNSSKTKRLAAVSGIAALTLSFFILVLGSGDNLIYRPGSSVSDYTITFWPNIHYIQRTMAEHGQWPLWRWSIFSGSPFDSDPQSGLWYPANLIFLLVPISWGFNLLFWLHSVAAGVGMWLWSKSVGTSDRGAFISGVSLAFAPRAFAHLGFGHLGLFYASAYIPWVLWGARGVAQGRGRYSAFVGLALGLQIIAHIQLAVYTSALAIGYILISRFRDLNAGNAAALAQESGAAVAGFLIAAAVSGIQLIPLLRFAPLSRRAQMLAGGQIDSALPPQYLLGLLLPDHTGFADFMLYAGIPVLVLATAAVLRREARLWVLAIGIMLMYALLTGIGPIAGIVTRIPMLGWLRSPARIWFVVAAVLALMAGWGYDEIVQRRNAFPIASSKLIVFGILIFVAFLLLGWRLIIGELPSNLLHFSLGISATAVLLLLWIRGKLHSRQFFVMLTAVLLIDLWVMDLTLVEGRSPQAVFTKTDLAARMADRIGDEPYRIYSPSYSLPRHTAALYGLQTVDGVDPLYLALYDEFVEMAAGIERGEYSSVVPAMEGGDPVEIVNRGALPDPSLLGLLNAKYLLSEFPLEIPEFHLLSVEGSTHVYENTRALPRAFLVNQTIPAEGAQEALSSLPLRDHSKAALVEDGPSLNGSAFEWRLVWVERTPNRLGLHVETEAHSFLVLSQPLYPDWEARVDGDQAEIYPTNGLFMGLELEPGNHLVALRYQPVTLLWGILSSLIGLGISLTLISWPGKGNGRGHRGQFSDVQQVGPAETD